MDLSITMTTIMYANDHTSVLPFDLTSSSVFLNFFKKAGNFFLTWLYSLTEWPAKEIQPAMNDTLKMVLGITGKNDILGSGLCNGT